MVITSPHCPMYKHQIHVDYYESINGDVWPMYRYHWNHIHSSFGTLKEMESFLYKLFKTTNYEIIDVDKL